MSESTSTTALATLRKSAGLSEQEWPDERIETVRKMYAPQAKSIHELAAFLATANRYGLDPVLSEVWLAPMQGGLKVVTGRDAMLKAARRDPGFKGVVSGVVYEKDTFRLLRNGDDVTVQHEVNGFDRGSLVGAYCVAYHTDRTPVVILRKWADYKHLHNKSTWKDYGDDMIETRVITAALRRQYQLAGLYHEHEFRDEKAAASTAKTADLNEALRAAQPTPEPETEAVDAEFEAEEEIPAADFEVVDDDEPALSIFDDANAP